MTGRPDIDELMMEYTAAADQVDQLTVNLGLAKAERNAVLAALVEAGLTQQAIVQLTGLTVTKLRTALWHDWRQRRSAA